MPTEISGSTGVNKIQDDTVVAADIASSVPLGKVLQVVSVADGTKVTSTSGQWVAHSGLVASITPSSTSSKIFISASCAFASPAGTNNFNIGLFRGSTNLGHSTAGFGLMFDGSSYYHGHTTPQFLDSPNTTSSTTYQVYFRSGSGGDGGIINHDNAIGTITLMEIAG